MKGFIVDSYSGKQIPKYVKSYLVKNDVHDFKIFTCDRKDRENNNTTFVEIYRDNLALQKLAFTLLEEDGKKVAETIRTLSLIFDIDLSNFTKRILLNEVYYNKAKLLMLEKCVLEKYPTIETVIFSKFPDVFEESDSVIICQRNSEYKKLNALILAFKKMIRNVIKFGFKNYAQPDVFDLVLLTDVNSFNHMKTIFHILNGRYRCAFLPYTFHETQDDIQQLEGIQLYKNHYRPKVSDFICIIKLLFSTRLQGTVLVKYIYSIYSRKRAFEDLLANYECRVIVAKNEYDPYQNIEYQVAKKKQVPVINYMHGEKFFNIRDFFVEYDWLMVWGRYYKELFEELHAKGEFVVVGNPHFDALLAADGTEVARSIRQIIKSRKCIISFFTQPSYGFIDEKQQEVILETLVSYIKKNNCFLIIKHHPREFKYPHPAYENIVGNEKNILCVKHGEHGVYELVMTSDIVVTPYSTVGFESQVLDKKVLYTNIGMSHAFLPYPDYGSAVEVNNPEHIFDGLDKLMKLEKVNYTRVKEHFANGIDGSSVDNFVAFIKSYVDKSPSRGPGKKLST
jgi:hypothetical protein